MSSNSDTVELEGVVVESLRGNFKIEIDSFNPDTPKYYVLAYLAGKLRKNTIRILPGDRVKVEVSPYDLNRGRIVYRLKSG